MKDKNLENQIRNLIQKPSIDYKSEEYQDVYNKSIKLVKSLLGVRGDKVNRSSNYFKDLGADSLDGIELIMEFEDEFDLNISDDDAEKIQTFGESVDYVYKRLKYD